MTEKSVFREAWSPELMSQSFPVSCFWCRGFVLHWKWNLTLLAHQNTGKENRYRKIVLLHLSAHWGDLIEQIKKICHIHFKRHAYANSLHCGLQQFTPMSWFEIIKIVSIQFLHVDLAKQVSIIFKTCCSCLCKVNMLQWERKHPQNTSFHKHLWHSFFISSIYFFCLYVSCVFGVTTMFKVLIVFFVFLFDRKSQKRSTRLRWHMRKLQ